MSLMGGAAAGRGEMLFRLWYRMRSLCGKYRLLEGLRGVVQHLLGLGLELLHLRVKLAAVFKAGCGCPGHCLSG